VEPKHLFEHCPQVLHFVQVRFSDGRLIGADDSRYLALELAHHPRVGNEFGHGPFQRLGRCFSCSRYHVLDGSFDAIVCELEPICAFFPQPKQDIQEVLILLCVATPLLLVCGHYIGQELVPRLHQVFELLIEARHPSHEPRRCVRQHVFGLEARHQRLGLGVPHQLFQLLCCRPSGTGGRAGGHRVGVAVQELPQLHGLPSLRGAACPCDERGYLGGPYGRERFHAPWREEVDHSDLLAPAPVLAVRRERHVAALIHQLIPSHAAWAGGESEVVVLEQIRGRGRSGHDQGRSAPELQEEETAAAAIANLQL